MISSCWQQPSKWLLHAIKKLRNLQLLLELVSLGLSQLSALLSLLDVSLDQDELACNFLVSELIKLSFLLVLSNTSKVEFPIPQLGKILLIHLDDQISDRKSKTD